MGWESDEVSQGSPPVDVGSFPFQLQETAYIEHVGDDELGWRCVGRYATFQEALEARRKWHTNWTSVRVHVEPGDLQRALEAQEQAGFNRGFTAALVRVQRGGEALEERGPSVPLPSTESEDRIPDTIREVDEPCPNVRCPGCDNDLYCPCCDPNER